jgi:DUF1680 family protein
LEGSHELYNLGHLYEAATAHFQATGKRSLVKRRSQERRSHLQDLWARARPVKEPPGHEEIEIGLVKLFRVTNDRKYLDQAQVLL